MNPDLNAAAEALLAQFQRRNPGGFSPTVLEPVQFFWTDQPAARQPLSYAPGLAVMLSGTKIGYLDGQRFEYGAGSYLAIGLPVVFECETHASREEPLVGLFLSFCPAELLELRALLEQDGAARLPKTPSLGVEPLKVKPAMAASISRLVGQLCQPHEASALGPGTLREIFFHALQDTHGRVLLSLTHMSRPEARIAELLRAAEASDGRLDSVEALARHAGMSPASLHRHFKGVTGYPPLQYFKRQRLIRARQLLASDKATISEVAFSVGYGSAAQFSRDFRTLFGHPPSQARAS